VTDDLLANPQAVIDEFHRLYYERAVTIMAEQLAVPMTAAHWLGLTVTKCPFDLWVYQEIIFDIRPQLIIECGTANGASALFLATICDAVGSGDILTIDNKMMPRRGHPRVTYLYGDVLADETLRLVRLAAVGDGPVMVILDDAHEADHVERELEEYGPLVTPGSYIVVEDTDINGHPVAVGWGDGPWEALERFMPRHPEFERDFARQKFLLTTNPGGYLRRI